MAGTPSNQITAQVSIILFFFVESVHAAAYIALARSFHTSGEQRGRYLKELLRRLADSSSYWPSQFRRLGSSERVVADSSSTNSFQ